MVYNMGIILFIAVIAALGGHLGWALAFIILACMVA